MGQVVAPKAPGQRRRRNASQGQWRSLPAEGSGREAPELLGEFVAATRDWWVTVWGSPMAAVWLEADVPALRRLAWLVDGVNRGESSAALMGEIRQLEDRFGLSPRARRMLQWEVSQAVETKAPREQVRGRMLRAV